MIKLQSTRGTDLNECVFLLVKLYADLCDRICECVCVYYLYLGNTLYNMF